MLHAGRPPYFVWLMALLLAFGAESTFAQRSKKVIAPDLTRGGARPEGWTHDWTLGPTGARGWMFSDKLVTSDARQILITEVAKKSPAAGVLRVGDVITGVGDKLFRHDARISFGKAITEAERKKNGGKLRLLRWRKGRTKKVVVKLKILGDYAATAPYECEKSKRILERGCKKIAEKMRSKPTAGHPITRALNALALLASGERKYLPLIREQVEILSKYDQATGVRTWQYAYINIFLAEYVLATGDRKHVKNGLQRITKMIVDGQSAVGSWGHGFILQTTNRLGGYGMMNAPGIPLTYSLVLAKKAEVRVPGLDVAIDKSKKLLRFYVGKGSIPYGDHRPWIETHCDNGKNEMAAVLFDFEEEAPATEYFSRMAVASHGAARDTGHTGNFFNMTWAMLGVARSGPEATGAWLEDFGWYYDLARRWDGSFLYQGAPTKKPEAYDNWDCTGAYVLAYAQSLKKIYLTGLKPSCAPAIDRATAEGLLDDGRGWSNKDRTSFYESLKTGELMRRLESWSPVVRERAAMELGRRQDKVIRSLIKLLSSQSLHARYGACRALHFQREKGAPAIPTLRRTLSHQDLWLRIQAAEALAGIGKPARVAVPEMLTRLTGEKTAADPRGMEQRYFTIALFNRREGLIGKSLEGIDQKLLIEGVRASLGNDDGRARGALSSVYQNLSFEQLKPLLPAILEAIKTPAPSGIMFADEIRTAGIELLAKHHVSEGIELLVDYARNQKQHASEHRIVRLMEMLEGYGRHAGRVIPRMKEVADYFENDEKDFPRRLSLDKARVVRETIKKIQAAKDAPKLVYLEPRKN